MSNPWALETSMPTKTSLSDFTGSFRESTGDIGLPDLAGYGLEAQASVRAVSESRHDDLRSRAVYLT